MTARLTSTVVDVRAGLAVTGEAIGASAAAVADARCRGIGASDTCVARAVGAAVGVCARGPVATVANVALAAVLSRPVMVAHSIGVAVIQLVVIAREDLVARATRESVAIYAVASVVVGSNVGAGPK